MNFIQNILQLYTMILQKKGVFLARFTKADNSIRMMKFTLDFDLIPKDKKPKTFNDKAILKKMLTSKIISVFDTEKNEWRSIPFERLEWVEKEEDEKKVRYRKK